MTIYDWILVACWAAFAGVWTITARKAKRTVGRDGSRRTDVVLGVGVALAVLGTLHLRHAHGAVAIGAFGAAHPLIGATGTVLCALGVAIAIWARLCLGANWGLPMSIKEAPELVTGGPYAWVRHPIYTGSLLAILGSTLVAGPWWLALFAVSCAYFVHGAFLEERRMLEVFPARYPEYMRRTRMLVPFVF